ncbi:MAG: UDP-N-acetylglucosamine 1-carboxyvinyltransferase [Oscillospiraceae bacterium]
MGNICVKGGSRLKGEISIHGAKNSSLPILAATILDKGTTVLHNCPDLSDVDAAIKILIYLGCEVRREQNTLIIDSTNIKNCDIPEHLMREMRSSVLFLGAIISRCQEANLFYPGGCELGPRPIDLHLEALRKLGATITEEYGSLACTCAKRMRGTKIALSFPSVGATENIIIAAVKAFGETTINNAAQEPEIVDLANFLISRGAKIKGAGKSTIVIKGVERLCSTEYTVMPDRIVAATYLSAAVITGGEITVSEVNPQDLQSVIPVFEQVGSIITLEKKKIHIKAPSIIKPVSYIRTMPYPGFPTDAQAPIMAMLTLAAGTSVFVENIFENRYKHAWELIRMGANIKVEGKVAVVQGVEKLYAARATATDLRGGAALVVAALAAKGETSISDIKHIDRGYEDIVRDLHILGGDIKRIADVAV